MKYLIDIGHPAHVHLFKNFARTIEKKGDKVKFTSRDKDNTVRLLKTYGFDYEIRGDVKPGLTGKALNLFKTDYKLYKIAKRFRPDLFLGVHNPYTAHVAKLMGKKSITFTDTERVPIASKLTFPVTDTICTPSCFREKLDEKKHVRFNGYKELAYLHPNTFKPEKGVLEELGIDAGEPYIVLRFISWGASHDIDLKGFKKGSELDYIKALEKYGRVLITSERKLAPALDGYRISCSPEKIHSLLNYAALYIGEGGTMATESAVLGTPAIHIESTSQGIASGNYYGNFLELRDVYDLLYFYANEESALEKAVEILEDKDTKKKWGEKRQRLLKEKIDVSAWMTGFIENYPESFIEYKKKEKTTKK